MDLNSLYNKPLTGETQTGLNADTLQHLKTLWHNHTQHPHPLHLEQKLEPQTRATPALTLISQKLANLANTPGARLIISVPPQEGKSTLAARTFPIWLLKRNPNTRIVIASAGQELAIGHGSYIKDTITNHPDLGINIRYGSSSKADWQLAHPWRGGVFSAGIGSSLTGHAADIVIIDDPVKDREQAESKTYRDRAYKWFTDVALTRLGSGAPVVVIMTRWHQDDLAGRLLAGPDKHRWQCINIPAQAEKNDILGRPPGEYLHSARGRTNEEWQQIRTAVGSQTWAALYQGRPSPAEGGIIHRDWWRYYTHPQWEVRGNGIHHAINMDTVLISGDLAFKDTAGSDYVALGVWARRGAQAYLLDLIRERLDFTETAKALIRLSAKWPQAALKLIEDKANGPAVMAFLRKKLPGLVPENPQKGKTERVNAVAPFIEAGNVFIPSPELCPWVGDFVEEFAIFPNGLHDDQVDMSSQAINRLLLQTFLTEQILEDSTLVDSMWDPVISLY